MTSVFSKAHAAPLLLAGALCVASPVWSQVAGGSTTVGVSVTESTQQTLGWSMKKTLLGKSLYNDQGAKVGKVEDLMPDRNVSYVIVGAGGFIGIGRHDVAVPVGRIQPQGGKLVMPGATKDQLKAMPVFVYTSNTERRASAGSGAHDRIERRLKRVGGGYHARGAKLSQAWTLTKEALGG